MVSRENAIILLCVAAALPAAYAVGALTGASDTARFGVVLAVGVLVPTLLNEYLGARDA
jgi:hypothetical protein